MYVLLMVLLLTIGGGLLFRGTQRKRLYLQIIGGVILLLTLAFFLLVNFWIEALWFDALGYSNRFWTEIFTKFGFGIIAALGFGLLILMATCCLSGNKTKLRWPLTVVTCILSFVWGYLNWSVILKYQYQISCGISDPILNRDVSFYLFSLPFYQNIYVFLLFLFILVLLAHITYLLHLFSPHQNRSVKRDPELVKKIYSGISLNAGLIAFIIALGFYLKRFRLLFSGIGIVNGAGWTDVHIRLPGYMLMIGFMLIAGFFLIVQALRQWLQRKNEKVQVTKRHWYILGGTGGGLFGIWFIFLVAIPALLQWLWVEPNEITREKPYIKNNIRFTRQAFKLDNVEERQFKATQTFTDNQVQLNPDLFDNIRLWDWRALISVYNQFQEIRLYYEFHDVDIDRYMIDDTYRQVMVSAREMQVDNLPSGSQTFVNRRFKYTHGYGLTLTKVNEFTPEGLPDLLIKDIPPQVSYPELEVKRPEIYYGELTNTPVIVNSSEKEFDYPKGDKNAYVNYAGNGGIPIQNLWRKFIFGWRFDGTKLLVSGYPTNQSRMMFRRQIKERARALAPFLEFDRDPYIVLAEGKLYWIIDAYTTSAFYPYSEAFNPTGILDYKRGRRGRFSRGSKRFGSGINYIRNSVKIVVDAYQGSTDFYIFDDADPIIKVWRKIFPGLFKDSKDMPKSLYKHIRYPAGLLLTQGLVYAKYHMTDPEVFYNQEDLWVRATEKYYGRIQPVEPYYIMWGPPDSQNMEFVLMLPFTPKNKQVLIGWIAGMCDQDNYGRFLAYKFPKKKRVLGPQQVETKIDQDSHLSGQLTLWDQRGSMVIRGNVLAIPIDDVLLYVEPIYLQSETAAYPELRLVVVMHNDNMSYGKSFAEALQKLLGNQQTDLNHSGQASSAQSPPPRLIQHANQVFEDYLRHMGDKRFNKAGTSLKELQQDLKKMLNMNNEKTAKE